MRAAPSSVTARSATSLIPSRHSARQSCAVCRASALRRRRNISLGTARRPMIPTSPSRRCARGRSDVANARTRAVQGGVMRGRARRHDRARLRPCVRWGRSRDAVAAHSARSACAANSVSRASCLPIVSRWPASPSASAALRAPACAPSPQARTSLLVSHDLDAAEALRNALVAAVRAGELPLARLEEAATRVRAFRRAHAAQRTAASRCPRKSPPLRARSPSAASRSCAASCASTRPFRSRVVSFEGVARRRHRAGDAPSALAQCRAATPSFPQRTDARAARS